ncbi:porin family protein [Mangrovicoccus ximenensis]|uniref:porin n=1 Tax=Mangrovicoccus ximenensis TaxID=1911570 RepID=UPI001374C95F|nr:porin [Mangrovicoccus ximenensis]
MSRLSLLSVLFGATALASGAATAQTFTSEGGSTVTFYGQIDPTLQSVDDGDDTDTDTKLVDNAASNSRLGFRIDIPTQESDKITLWFETALGFAQSGALTQDGDFDGIDWTRRSLRHVEAIYDSKRFGTFSAGQGSMATDGIAETDFSGTGLAGHAAMGDLAGSYRFRDKDGTLSDVSIGQVFNDFDGARRMRVRYDTPDLLAAENAKLTLAAAYGQEVLQDDNHNDYYDASIRYTVENDALQFSAGLGYAAVEDDNDVSETAMTSASIWHKASGLTASVSYGGGLDNDNDATFAYGKLGYRTTSFFRKGYTAFSIDYGHGEDFVVDGDESDAIGVQATRDFGGIGPNEQYNLAAYVGYRTHAYDAHDGSDYHDLQAFTAGLRIGF